MAKSKTRLCSSRHVAFKGLHKGDFLKIPLGLHQDIASFFKGIFGHPCVCFASRKVDIRVVKRIFGVFWDVMCFGGCKKLS